MTFDEDNKPPKFKEMLLSVQHESSIENFDNSIKSPMSIIENYHPESKVNQSASNLYWNNYQSKLKREVVSSQVISPSIKQARNNGLSQSVYNRK